MTNVALSIIIEGKIQGLGIRPLIYNIAEKLQISGWVKNIGGGVTVFCQGNENKVHQFVQTLKNSTRLWSAIKRFEVIIDTPDNSVDCFTIKQSEHSNTPRYVPQDSAVCKECLIELFDKNNRRYKYPFISCTQCGPRFSLLRGFPLDRQNSSLNEHKVCSQCKAEYKNSADRRFHAQNINCPQCGPTLSLVFENTVYTEDVISHCSDLLKQGKIVALKGTSGYRLMTDASNQQAVAILRQRKNRLAKPFAVMLADIEAALKVCLISNQDIEILQSRANSILLLPKSLSRLIAENVAPNTNEFGIYLPGTGLEHLLLKNFKKPLVSTSANLSGQVLIFDEKTATEKLSHVADAFLHHNLQIENPSDDSVWRSTGKELQPVRLGRGYAPVEIKLPFHLKQTVIALGTQDKATFSLAWGNRLVMSPHIGDLSEHSCWVSLQKKILQITNLYEVTPQIYVIDKHPSYTSSQWIKRTKLAHAGVLHHHAHASSLYLSMPQNEDALIFTWDGIGVGENNQLWGGEAFVGQPGSWRRVISLMPFPLPGSDKCMKEIWRTGISLQRIAGFDMPKNDRENTVKQILSSKINSPLTSSVGRLFDGVTAILGILDETSFDGQGPMYLENLATSNTDDFVELQLIEAESGIHLIDYRPLIRSVSNSDTSCEYRASLFHNSLARVILQCAQLICKSSNIKNIGFTGGVFQNRTLSNKAQDLLSEQGFNVFNHDIIPSNDASISVGQIVEYAAKQ